MDEGRGQRHRIFVLKMDRGLLSGAGKVVQPDRSLLHFFVSDAGFAVAISAQVFLPSASQRIE
jgi:hypothetical protein